MITSSFSSLSLSHSIRWSRWCFKDAARNVSSLIQISQWLTALCMKTPVHIASTMITAVSWRSPSPETASVPAPPLQGDLPSPLPSARGCQSSTFLQGPTGCQLLSGDPTARTHWPISWPLPLHSLQTHRSRCFLTAGSFIGSPSR